MDRGCASRERIFKIQKIPRGLVQTGFPGETAMLRQGTGFLYFPHVGEAVLFSLYGVRRLAGCPGCRSESKPHTRHTYTHNTPLAFCGASSHLYGPARFGGSCIVLHHRSFARTDKPRRAGTMKVSMLNAQCSMLNAVVARRRAGGRTDSDHDDGIRGRRNLGCQSCHNRCICLTRASSGMGKYTLTGWGEGREGLHQGFFWS